MSRKLGDHIRSNVVGYYGAVPRPDRWHRDGGRRLAPRPEHGRVGGHHQQRGDADDLAAESVGTRRSRPGRVKNKDLVLGASSSNTIADGGIRGSTSRTTRSAGGRRRNEGSLDGDELEFDAVSGAEIESGTVQDSDLESAIVRPKAMAISDGNCVTRRQLPARVQPRHHLRRTSGPGLVLHRDRWLRGNDDRRDDQQSSAPSFSTSPPRTFAPTATRSVRTRRRLPGRSVWRTASNSGWPCTDGSVEQASGLSAVRGDEASLRLGEGGR